MITTAEVADILYRDCQAFGVEVFRFGNLPQSEVLTERITIHVKAQEGGKIWRKCFAEVNLCVPDRGGVADLSRLQALEREAHARFDNGVTGTFDGSTYYYSSHTIGQEADTALKCHFVNVRILFEVLNIQ